MQNERAYARKKNYYYIIIKTKECHIYECDEQKEAKEKRKEYIYSEEREKTIYVFCLL